MSTSIHRFYLPPSLWTDGEMTLPPGESRHACTILRLAAGDLVHLMDGAGRIAPAEITRSKRDSVSVRFVAPVNSIPVNPRPRPAITLAAALTKGKAWDATLAKATELAATIVQPLHTEHCVVRVDNEAATSKSDKWTGTLIEAAKQCGTEWLPDLRLPVDVATWARSLSSTNSTAVGELRLWASLHPGAIPLHKAIEAFQSDTHRQPNHVVIAVGPEGDFSEGERTLFDSSQFIPVRLGPFTMRADTACLAALAILRAAPWRD